MSFLLPTAITSRLSAGFGGPDSSSKGNSSSNTVETRASSSVKESEPLARPATLAWLALYRILQQPHRQSSLDTAKDKGGADVVGNPEKGDSTAQEDVGPSNEDKEEGDKSDLDILFYSSKELAVTSAQIRRQIGLLRGAADFCASMLPETDASGTDQDGVYTVHSQQHRNVVMKLEEEIWLAVSIEVPRWTKSTVPKVRYAYDEEWRPDSWMVKSLKSAWETWSMLNGKASKQLADGREGRQRLERSLERYFSVWASRWDVAGRAFSSAKESKTKPLVASEALESFLSIDRELQKTDGREEAVICTCARERIGRRVKSVKESPAQTKETVETLCEMMLFRTGKMVLHEAAKSEVKASNRTISLLYNHIRSTYKPIFAEQASRLRNTIRQRRRLEASSKGSGTGRSSLQPIDKASHRLSWLSLWSSPEDTSVDSKAESVISDARNPASNAQEETRGGPKETQKPISPTRSFPSISVTSSAWFGSAAPAPKAAQKEAATEVEGGEGGKGEADEPTEVEDPVPPFEELSLRGWAAGEGQDEGSSVKVRFLVRGDLLLLVVFQEEANEATPIADEDEEYLRTRVWKALQSLVPDRLSSENALRFECDLQQGTVHSKPGGSGSGSNKDSKLLPPVQATTRKMLMLHESAMRANPNCVTEVMSRSNQGDAWMRSWHASDHAWTHAIVPDGRLSMAAADLETSSSASTSTTKGAAPRKSTNGTASAAV